MFFNYYNEKAYYEEFGEGEPILIIHGLACNIELMKGCIEPIFKKVNGYKRIYIDLLGMGKSNLESNRTRGSFHGRNRSASLKRDWQLHPVCR